MRRPSARASVEELYADLPFPFVEEPFPPMEMTARWPVERLIGYSATWSSTLALVRARGAESLRPLHDAIRSAWGKELRIVRWPLGGRAGRVA